MSARGLRIGEVAERVGVTTRTIRYYEERGLLGRESQREKGAHRLYGEADVVRLQELIRLRDLLGLSLEELVELAEAGRRARRSAVSGPKARPTRSGRKSSRPRSRSSSASSSCSPRGRRRSPHSPTSSGASWRS